MYTRNLKSPSKFGRPHFASKAKPHFGGGRFNRKKVGRSHGERIDFSRFIKKGQHAEEKPYVSKHTFLDFPFNPQLHTNIKGAGFETPRPIQDQSIPTVLSGKDV